MKFKYEIGAVVQHLEISGWKFIILGYRKDNGYNVLESYTGAVGGFNSYYLETAYKAIYE